jgi:hypothetical protein
VVALLFHFAFFWSALFHNTMLQLATSPTQNRKTNTNTNIANNAKTTQKTAAYEYVDGMQPLLARLSAAGVAMHAMSNYPSWWRHVEAKLQVSRYLPWTFVSCEGAMKVGEDVGAGG